MLHIDQLTLLHHQWNDFSHRLKQLIRSSSQYERVHFDYVHSSLSDTEQNVDESQEQFTRKETFLSELLTIEKIKHVRIHKSIEDIQLNVKTNENIIEKANKRLDGTRNMLRFYFLFLNIFYSCSSGHE
ncbi:unnamed protein product [Rotaria magnacalcarata]|uniref:Uncharacterized protein n=1 Tax=Rotaria magnacalcarata TaxID=392030 RepID=A0A819E953_9BILA|nr:unnamed protein product [Rotaria magnacalcarata]CAF3854869.1 unnamed protein product [Rotaria magnacalcarata]